MFIWRELKADEMVVSDKKKSKKIQDSIQKITQKPFVVAYVDSNSISVVKSRTEKVIGGGASPVFTEEHDCHLEVDFPGIDDPTIKPMLRVELWNYCRYKADELLGLIDIPLLSYIEQASFGITEEKWFTLIDRNGLERGTYFTTTHPPLLHYIICFIYILRSNY